MQHDFPYNDSLQEALQVCVDRNLNFAVYRLPGNPVTTLLLQTGGRVNVIGDLAFQLPDKGFLIAPFTRNGGERVYLIRPDRVFRDAVAPSEMDMIRKIPENPPGVETPLPIETGREAYLQQVSEIVERIQANEFEKVVLSRVKSYPGHYIHRLPELFRLLCMKNPDAFVYLFCVDGVFWTGATPEPLLCTGEDTLNTVSLAATRPFDEQYADVSRWSHKEIREQEYVTRHIEKVLLDFSVQNYLKKGPYMVRAGNLSHLRTDFTFSPLEITGRLPRMIDSLHPTPAVCGMDSGKAMEFIRLTEKHSREFYSGFLGPAGLDGLFQLYVNVRCMKVLPGKLLLYTGGGITRESIPADEWEETEWKSETLLSVVKQLP